jgi:hypothetical protein
VLARAGSRFPLLTRRAIARRVECIGAGGITLALADAAGYSAGVERVDAGGFMFSLAHAAGYSAEG